MFNTEFYIGNRPLLWISLENLLFSMSESKNGIEIGINNELIAKQCIGPLVHGH